MLFLVLVTILALVSLPTPSASKGNNTLTLPARVINTNEQVVCPSDEVQEMVRDEIFQDIRNMIRNTILPTHCLGQTQASPVTSCTALPANCPSDYYWVASSNGTAVHIYCDMDRVCGCNSTGGFTRVANLNMSKPSEQCPGELVLQTYSSEPRRLCGRGSSSGASCVSAVYNTYGISYSHVCGRVIGYQYASPDGFHGTLSIEGSYVDGVSLTHGEPGTRVHIWSLTATWLPVVIYPCGSAPTFVENDYFCDSGSQMNSWNRILYAGDPLWDGQGPGELISPSGVSAPWFCKQLPQTTTDDIEIRICGNEGTHNEDTPVEIIELYIR